MAEPGSRTPASRATAGSNLLRIIEEPDFGDRSGTDAGITTRRLRQELQQKGLKGFKRGGRVKKTGIAKVHKGERVLTAKTARKVTPAKLRAATRKTATRRK